MKLVNVQEFRSRVKASIDAPEPTLITRYGRPAAFLIPLEASDEMPDHLRRELLKALGAFIRLELKKANITEDDLLEDFKQARQSHSRC